MRPDFDEVMRFYPQTIGTYWLANDHRMVTDTFIRRFALAGALGEASQR